MKRIAIASLFALATVSCSEDPETMSTGPAGGKADDTNADGVDTRGYRFVDTSELTVRRDHAGAPLLATIWGRIDEYSEDAPFVETSANGLEPWLLHITTMFHAIHASWSPSLEEMGLDTCDDLGVNDDLFADFGNGKLDWGNLEPEQCFGQRMKWPNPDTGKLESYRRTIEVSLPDYLTVDITKPAGFPNGRVLHEQINSLMFAMAFLDQGGDCEDDSGEVVECNLHTLWERSDFLKKHNDVPYRGASKIGDPATEFPFLADPHEL